jgi:hypothetical protein
MSLGPTGRSPSRTPDVAPGDRVQVTAEAEVTTDCERRNPACVGNPSTYARMVQARLLLAESRSEAEAKGRAKLIKELRPRPVSHKQHHQVIVFTDAELRVREQDLPEGGARPTSPVARCPPPGGAPGPRAAATPLGLPSGVAPGVSHRRSSMLGGLWSRVTRSAGGCRCPWRAQSLEPAAAWSRRTTARGPPRATSSTPFRC